MAKDLTTTQRLPALAGDTGLKAYLQQIQQFPLLEAGEEYMLAKRYSEHQDKSSAHQLVTSHLRLVAKIALGYRGYGMPVNEMIAEGNIGLMHAVEKFDPDKGFRLSTYAMWWIRAAIQEYILRSWSLVKLGTTAAQKKLFFNLRRIKNKIGLLSDKSLKPEDAKKIASTLEVKPEEVQEVNARIEGDVSLNVPTQNAEGESAGEWQDLLPSEENNQEERLAEADEKQQRHAMIQKAMTALNERERAILTARRLQDSPSTLAELAKTYDISRERVRQIEATAFQKLSQAVQAQA